MRASATILSVFGCCFLFACGSSERENGGSSGSGGATSGGSAGAGLTTSGGSGGANVGGGAGACGDEAGSGAGVPGTCDPTATLTTSQSLIHDFECGGEFSYIVGPDGEPLNGYPHGGYVYHADELEETCAPWPGVTVTTAGTDTPGHDSTTALHLNMSKPAANWGGGMGIWITGCVNVSDFTGISFWARGATTQDTVNVTISTFETTKAPFGSCTQTECAPFSNTITLPATADVWQQYELAWADFAPHATNTPAGATLDGSNVKEIGFYINTWDEVETLDFWLDDVEFMGGTSQLPRSCEAAGGAGGGGG